MKAFIGCLTACSVAWSSTIAFASSNSNYNLVTDKLVKETTLGGMIKVISGQINPAMFAFINKQVAGKESTPVKLVKTGDNKYAIQSSDLIVPIELKDYQFEGKFEFLVNSKTITYAPKTTPQELWDNIVASLPKRTASVVDLFLPRAEAIVPLILGAAMVAGVVGFSVFGTEAYQIICNDLPTSRSYCARALESARGANGPEALKTLEAFAIDHQKWVEANVCADSSIYVYNSKCLRQKYNRIKEESGGKLIASPPLRKFFGEPELNSPSPNSETKATN